MEKCHEEAQGSLPCHFSSAYFIKCNRKALTNITIIYSQLPINRGYNGDDDRG